MSFLSFFKYVLFIFNFIVMSFGAAVLGLSIYFYIDTIKYVGYSAISWPIYSTVFIIVVGIGLLSFIVGFFGCCGACKESSCMLCLYLTICIAICALAGTLVYLSEQNNISASDIKLQMQHDIEIIIQRSYSRYNETSVANIVIDNIQEDFQCCGSNNFTDWASSAQNNRSKYDAGVFGKVESSYLISANPTPPLSSRPVSPSRSQRQISFFKSQSSNPPNVVTATFRVPISCCSTSNENSYNQCKSLIARYDANPSEDIQRIPNVNPDGCIDKIYDYLIKEYRWPLNIIGGLAIGLQGLSIIFSFCLCCAINRAIDDDDDDEDGK